MALQCVDSMSNIIVQIDLWQNWTPYLGAATLYTMNTDLEDKFRNENISKNEDDHENWNDPKYEDNN